MIIPIEKIRKIHKRKKSEGFLFKKKKRDFTEIEFEQILKLNRIMMLKNKGKVDLFMEKLR